MNFRQDIIQGLRDDFRHRLEFFYAGLKLAPPYHSVEKAITRLTTLFQGMTPEEQERVGSDSAQQWALYRRAFVESGLNQKHSGIIAGMLRAKKTSDLPDEYEPFLSSFLS